ncbi:hypothetical protein PoB_001154400 [Plakobranchus ocellatus]|uniref:Uncharacterized protein n=1 Tax=Plakobranchus ocellatus TaxID=259542 RepID=A0AAV3YSL1_9GAST|nr:hypothetical protein PoB_001154400 [Plakobranchus ocellatus]
MVWFLYLASQQQGDVRLLGPPPGLGASSGARTRDRRVPADLRADSLTTVPPTPPISYSNHSFRDCLGALIKLKSFFVFIGTHRHGTLRDHFASGMQLPLCWFLVKHSSTDTTNNSSNATTIIIAAAAPSATAVAAAAAAIRVAEIEGHTKSEIHE